MRQKGDKRSWKEIKEVLQTHQMVTVVLPDGDEKHIHHIRVATEPSAEQMEIYRKLNSIGISFLFWRIQNCIILALRKNYLDIKPMIKRKKATFKKIDL